MTVSQYTIPSVVEKTARGERAYRERIGYMPQSPRFPDHLTGNELIDLMTDLRGPATRPLDRELPLCQGEVPCRPHHDRAQGRIVGVGQAAIIHRHAIETGGAERFRTWWDQSVD